MSASSSESLSTCPTHTYRPTVETLRELQGRCQWWVLRQWSLPLLVSVLVPAAVLLAVNLLLPVAIALGLILLGLLWVVVMARRQDFDPRLLKSHTLTLEPDAFAGSNDDGYSRLSWELVDRIILSRRQLLYATRGYTSFFGVPRASFADADQAEAFIQEIRARMATHEPELQPREVQETVLEQVEVVHPLRTPGQIVRGALVGLFWAILLGALAMQLPRVVAEIVAVAVFFVMMYCVFRLIALLPLPGAIWWKQYRMQPEKEAISLLPSGVHRVSRYSEGFSTWRSIEHVENANGQIVLASLPAIQIPESAFRSPDDLNRFVNTASQQIETHLESRDGEDVPVASAVESPSDNPYAAPKVEKAVVQTGVQVFEFDLTEADIQETLLALAQRRASLAVVFVAILAILLLNLIPYAAIPAGILGTLILSLLVYLLAQLGAKARLQEQLRSQPVCLPGRKRIAVMGEVVFWAADDDERQFPIKQLRLAGQPRKRIVLTHGKKRFIVPRSSLPRDAYDTLRKTLTARGVRVQ